MKNYVASFLMCFAFLLVGLSNTEAASKSRGLWASKSANGQNVFVSWRMRSTDAPKSTTYKLYADGNLVGTMNDKTNISLPSNYANSTFSLEVLNSNGEVIDSQSGIKCTATDYYPIALQHPGTYNLNGTQVTYAPYDCSAYDMDGDGEQEIIMCWSAGEGATAAPTAPPILDCIKLDGTRLWRINIGPNVMSGCRFVFLCYDFDGDGYGEVIVKTAQGAKDATGNFLSKGAAAGANHYASSVNSSGVITSAGKEWLTCFDGRTGKELATIDYWPYFNIQNDWDDRRDRSDGATYGHRGNWMKGCVAFLNVNGKPKPCFVTTRGIYTYSYAAAYTWDGKSLTNLWRHTSDRAGQGIYGQGAHSITCGDVDGDGFDEIIVGAACLDHDGSVLWRTGLGHGDATHLGEFDPSNPGLEYFLITEESSAAYDCALLDAKTGKVLLKKDQSGGDTGRGLILDCDGRYDGAEIMEWSFNDLFTCKGKSIGPWHVGSTNSSSINFRIFWDGDLLEEYTDRGHVDKWNSSINSWERMYTYGYNITINGVKLQWGANTNNATKYNPCLQADLIGDWREESIFWTVANGTYYLTIYPTTIPSDYKLPWLRDDHVYDMAVAWQNCGYNQPPHLGYSPVEYYKQLAAQNEPATLTKHGAGPSAQTVKEGDAIVDFSYSWTNAASVTVTGLPEGVKYTIDTNAKTVYISGTVSDKPGKYSFDVTTVGNDENAHKSGQIVVLANQPASFDYDESKMHQTIYLDSVMPELQFAWEGAETVVLEGDLPEGVEYKVDKQAKTVVLYGTPMKEGDYKYCLLTQGGNPDATVCGSFSVEMAEETSLENVISRPYVSIIPNPMTENAEIYVGGEPGTSVNWSVSTLSGVVCQEGIDVINARGTSISIQRESMVSGIYLVKLEMNGEPWYLKLIVK